MPCLTRLLLAAALTFACLPAKAQEGNPTFLCASVIQFMGAMRDMQRTPGAKVEQLEGVEADAFMAFYNAQEPATDYKADIVVFVYGPELGTVTFVHGDRACLFRQPIPTEAIRGMLSQVRQKVGQPA